MAVLSKKIAAINNVLFSNNMEVMSIIYTDFYELKLG